MCSVQSPNTPESEGRGSGGERVVSVFDSISARVLKLVHHLSPLPSPPPPPSPPLFSFPYSVSASVFDLLRSVVLEPEQGPTKVRILAATVLRELAPSQHNFVKEFGPPMEERNVQFFLPVLLAQGNLQDKLSVLLASQIFRSFVTYTQLSIAQLVEPGLF